MGTENYSYRRRHITCRRLVWITFARSLTFFIPNFLLIHVGGLKTSSSRIAWREKVALLALYLFSAGFFYFWLEFISCLFCEPEKTYPYAQICSNSSKLSVINGKVVNWRNEDKQLPMVDFVNKYPHFDLSANFPKFMMLSRISSDQTYSDSILNECIYSQNKSAQADSWLSYLLRTDPGYTVDAATNTLKSCPLPTQRNVSGAPCFYGSDHASQLDSLPIKGELNPYYISKFYKSLPTPQNFTKEAYVILDGYVLDVTYYLKGVTKMVRISSTLSSRAIMQDRMFLPLDLTLFLYLNLGKDISDYFNGNVTENPSLYRTCLVHLFQKGVVPSYASAGCRRINPALWATLGVGFMYFLIKMNLVYLSRLLFRSPRPAHQWPYTILMIPCFAESSDILKQTLDSLSRTTYDDSRKLLLFVCDGVVTNAKETQPTHTLLLECLGYSGTEEPAAQAYQSLLNRANFAHVYSGYYETGRNRVPYVVVVKSENRGKRDSLVLVFGFLERCMDLSRHFISPLEYEMLNHIGVLGFHPRQFKYLMVTDADIQVQNDIVEKLVSRLEQERDMLAVSGHVRPANPEENLTTMLQIFPAYMTYFSSLAFEAILGRVMSSNGGLIMYKVWTEEQPKLTEAYDEKKTVIKPCCVNPTVIRGIATTPCDTMHLQNVLLQGEEKIIPIILLKSHPGHRLGFEPDAIGYTMLPTNFWVLQRVQSRSIRAAFHTQIEIQQVSCKLGFRYWLISTTQLLDMIFTMPVMVYLYGIFGRTIRQYGMAYAIIAASFIGLGILNVVLLVLRHQFRYIFWFVLYCVFAIPLFAIWFPVLSVWQSNDARYKYDKWRTSEGYRRLHGLVHKPSDPMEMEVIVPRMKLADHEAEEARRLNQALDSKFVGFNNEALQSEIEVTPPPVAQLRASMHSTRGSKVGLPDFKTKRSDDLLFIPDPFEDVYHVAEEATKCHRPSHSQSSYPTSHRYETADESTLLNSMSSSGFAKLHEETVELECFEDDCSSTLSIASNTFSVFTPDLEEHVMPRHRLVGGSSEMAIINDENGRNRAVHNFTNNLNHSTNGSSNASRYNSKYSLQEVKHLRHMY